MEIRRLDRAALGPVNNWSQRLVPWAALNAPFEGAWCVVRPGGESQRHAHHEYEIFIAVAGEAVLESAGESTRFAPGDVVHFPPHVEHQVRNLGERDFEMYTIWWDRDMSDVFTDRHAGGA